MRWTASGILSSVSGMALEPFQFLFSENFNIYIQGLGNPFLDTLFKAITNTGSEPAYIFIASLVFWCYNKKTGIRIMYVILFSAFAAILAKNLFGMPRPPEYLHKIKENELGFPSGHALISAGFWGYIGARTKNIWLIIAGVISVFSISLSRVYLGVHYIGDVIGGIIFGLLIAIISFKAEPGIINKLEKLSRSLKYSAVVVLPLLLVTIAAMQESLLKEQAEIGLVMGGVGVGFILENERVGFEDVKNNKQRVKRMIIGVAVLGIIYLISSLLFMINPNFVFFKYAALGFASTFIAPWAFTRMNA